METKQITKKEFINTLISAKKCGFVWGGYNRKVDFKKVISENYDEFAKDSGADWRTIQKANNYQIVWSNGSTLSFTEIGTKTYWRIGRIIMQLNFIEDSDPAYNNQSAVIYLLPNEAENVA